ncbi:MAG: DNA repair protein RadC [Clostridiales bacterium]|nr:DNA repair protein RadC [Clostridiales bacterium]
MKICELSPTVRPYERLEEFGAEALSDEELIAILIRTGTKGKSSKEIASQLLSHVCLSEGLSDLNRISLSELSSQEGIGRVKAIMLKACIELGRRCYSDVPGRDKLQFSSAEVAISYFENKMAYLETEEVHAVFLDSRNKMISYEVISKGSLGSVGFFARELFKTAVRCNAASVIVAHNHPSGDPTPSEEDYLATAGLLEAGNLMGIEIKDHIVVGRGISISMQSQGMMEVRSNED